MNLITIVLSKVTGVPEPTLRLLLTVLAGYPVANAYYKNFLKQDAEPSIPSQRVKFILMAGLALNFFFNTFSMYHSLVTISVSYALCYFIGEQQGDRKLAAAGVWIFNAAYLLLGYWYMQTDEYDITWTMTQCILCLRLMGFGFDYYDGRKKVTVPTDASVHQTTIRATEKKKESVALPLSFQADTPLTELPPALDVFAYCLFPAAFLVGPQFSFSLFKKWINDDRKNLTNEQIEERERAQSVYVWRSVALAVIYLGLQQTIGSVYSTSYLLTDEYSSLGFFKRLVIFFVAGKFAYVKYIGIWLLTEGAIAAFGISYEGTNNEGQALYGGLANALPEKFETATSIDHVIGAFNINTNLWSKYYVFKRLKFLNNKQISQFGTLFFLAIWHGFHMMYFVTFLLEFLYVKCESILRKRLSPLVQPYIKQNDIFAMLWKVVAWCTCQMCITYAVVGFELLGVGKTIKAYSNVYFLGHLPIVIILAADAFLPKPKSAKKKAQ